MASRVPLLLKNKGRKPTRLPIAPRVKPSNDRSKRLSTDTNSSPAPLTEQDANDATASSAVVVHQPEREPPVDSAVATAETAETEPPPPPVVTAQLTPRAGAIAPGGSLAAGSRALPITTIATAKSPVLPVQRAPEQRMQQVERLAKISSAGPVYNSRPGHHVSPVLGPRATILHPPAISTHEQHPATKRLVRKLDIKPHQSPRRIAQAHALLHAIPPMVNAELLPAARVATTSDMSQPAATAGDATKAKPKPKATAAATAKKKKAPTAKRRTTDSAADASKSERPTKVARRSLRRSVTKTSSYRAAATGENDDDALDDAAARDGSDSSDNYANDDDDDNDPTDFDVRDDDDDEATTQVFVPARERATMWAKSVLKLAEEGEDGENKDHHSRTSPTSTALVKRSPAAAAARRKRSNSSMTTGSSSSTTRTKTDELLKKEPSQMTMGELALTVPKGKRVNRFESEVAASNTQDGITTSSSKLLNTNALSRMRSFSVTSESAALGGSIVTPQVEIIDGKMVVLESTVKMSDVATRHDDMDDGGDDDNVPRRSGARYYAQPHTPGKRWAKDETKQFYYCLSQVGPNFSMMATLFPSRKRKELKCKFKYEEKHHPALIEIALKASTAPLDSEMVSVIAQMVDKDAKKKTKTKTSKATKHIGDESPASTALGGASTPPLPQLQDEEFLDDFDAFYPRERSNSFDFAG